MNLTDVDDRTIKGAADRGRDGAATTRSPSARRSWPTPRPWGCGRRTLSPGHGLRGPMVDFIERLLESGHAYQADDGAVYFSIARFPGLRQAQGDRSFHAPRRRPGRPGRLREGGRPGLRALEGGPEAGREGRGRLGRALGQGPAGMAPGVLGHERHRAGRHAGLPSGGRRPGLPPPRERDRAVGGRHRQALRALLAAREAPSDRGSEDVQVAGQLHHGAGAAGQGLRSGRDPPPAPQRPSTDAS